MGPAPRITFPASGRDLFFIEQAQFVARGSGVPGATVRLERFHEEEGGWPEAEDDGGWRTVPDSFATVVADEGGGGSWEIALKADDSGNPTADVGTHRLRAVQAVPGAPVAKGESDLGSAPSEEIVVTVGTTRDTSATDTCVTGGTRPASKLPAKVPAVTRCAKWNRCCRNSENVLQSSSLQRKPAVRRAAIWN